MPKTFYIYADTERLDVNFIHVMSDRYINLTKFVIEAEDGAEAEAKLKEMLTEKEE